LVVVEALAHFFFRSSDEGVGVVSGEFTGVHDENG